MAELTIPPGSGAVILGYVHSKAAAWTVAQLVERVRDAVTVLERAAGAVPEDALDQVPAGEEWSPLDCIRHVAEINAATALRCADSAAPGDAMPAGPLDWASRTRETAMEAMVTAINAAFARIEAAEAAGDGMRGATWPHPFLGELDWREWLLTIRVHSLAHAEQLGTLTAGRG